LSTVTSRSCLRWGSGSRRTSATKALGFGRDQLAACLDRALELPDPDPEALYRALAAPDGICANLSIFNRADVLTGLVDLPVPHDDGKPQPLLVPAARLESLAHGFLASRHVIALTPGRCATREILAVQQRIVARYRHGLHRGAALVPSPAINQALARQPVLTDEQRDLVRVLCTSGHRIQCAVGRAGAGKTTTMAAARNAWQAAGWRVIGTAVKGAKVGGPTSQMCRACSFLLRACGRLRVCIASQLWRDRRMFQRGRLTALYSRE
jgi:hypothetical protein